MSDREEVDESAGGSPDGDANGSGAEDRADGDESGPLADATVWKYLRLGAIGLLALLAVVATIQLYTNVSSAIGQWVAPEYVSTFQATFNLVVLLLALAGLAVLARRR